MTLDTRIYVQSEVDHRSLFLKCNQLLRAGENVRSSDDGACIMNEPEQGLDAWLMIHYGSPLRATVEHDDDCDPDCDYAGHVVPCWSEVSFDTAYSYSGPDGGCGNLHARLVAELGAWLDERGASWSWQNEFTGEIFERYEGLTELGGGGAEASLWFREIALPAIQRGIL